MTDDTECATIQSERGRKEDTTMKVKFDYYYGGFKSAVSKVYGEKVMRMPSGYRQMIKVWNNDRKMMEWIHKDSAEMVEA